MLWDHTLYVNTWRYNGMLLWRGTVSCVFPFCPICGPFSHYSTQDYLNDSVVSLRKPTTTYVLCSTVPSSQRCIWSRLARHRWSVQRHRLWGGRRQSNLRRSSAHHTGSGKSIAALSCQTSACLWTILLPQLGDAEWWSCWSDALGCLEESTTRLFVILLSRLWLNDALPKGNNQLGCLGCYERTQQRVTPCRKHKWLYTLYLFIFFLLFLMDFTCLLWVFKFYSSK